jgi:hypothetical protein
MRPHLDSLGVQRAELGRHCAAPKLEVAHVGHQPAGPHSHPSLFASSVPPVNPYPYTFAASSPLALHSFP